MKRVFKYPVPANDYFFLDLPQGAEILTIQEQNNKPQIWALVNPKNPIESRSFCLAGTGHPIEENEKKPQLHWNFPDGKFSLSPIRNKRIGTIKKSIDLDCISIRSFFYF